MPTMNAHKSPNLRLGAAALVSLLAGIAGEPPARADFLLGLDPHPDVLTVTDTTPDGQKLPPASPQHPVYYVAEDLGFREFGSPMSGDTIPPHKSIVAVIVKTLQKQGYIPADKAHQPTQFIIFSWGTMYAHANPLDNAHGKDLNHPADPQFLKFMGGDKADLMWMTPTNNPNITNGGNMVDARTLTQGLRSQTAQKIYDAAQGDLYVAALGGYDFKALAHGQSKQLWQTRIACPAEGLALADTMPVMIAAAGPFIGRETAVPVWKDTAHDLEPHVEVGQEKVVEYIDPDKAPVIDATKVGRSSQAETP
jgi:hypothetical protein